MKCVFRKTPDLPICGKLAEYVTLGRSWCKKHMEIRVAERNQAIKESDERVVEMKYALQDDDVPITPSSSVLWNKWARGFSLVFCLQVSYFQSRNLSL